MNGISLAPTPKGSSQHQNQSSSMQGSQTHNLWTQEKTSTTISQSRGWITYWIKIAAEMKLAFFVSSQWFCRHSYREGLFLAVHGRQCLRLSTCWLACDCRVFLCFQPQASRGFFQPVSQRKQTRASRSCFSFLQPSDVCRTSLCLRVAATPGESTTALAREENAALPCAKEGSSLAPADPHCRGTHTPCRLVTCPTCRDSVGAEPAVSLPIFTWYLSHWQQPKDSEIPGGSGKPLRSALSKFPLPPAPGALSASLMKDLSCFHDSMVSPGWLPKCLLPTPHTQFLCCYWQELSL